MQEHIYMEQRRTEAIQERQFDLERAIGLRELVRINTRQPVQPRAGRGEVLNRLLEKYPGYHPAGTLGSTIRGYEQALTCLVLDIANCEEITAETGDDLQTAVMYGLEIVYNRCRENDSYTQNTLSNLAYEMAVGQNGRIDFSPMKPVEEIDPFRHLDSIFSQD